MMYKQIVGELNKYANQKRAEVSKWFFKTGKGEYAEGDVFIGIAVPDTRKIAQQFYTSVDFKDIEKLIINKIHEQRLLALIILTLKYKKNIAERQTIVDFYLTHLKHINNWDLVDTSAPHILGHYFFDKDKSQLYQFSQSNNLWIKRIAIVATQYFIRQNSFVDTIKIAVLLLNDKHDLIHKATGWMLREMGKKNLDMLLLFLDKHYQQMPRTMLRYAIEKLPPETKAFYLKKK